MATRTISLAFTGVIASEYSTTNPYEVARYFIGKGTTGIEWSDTGSSYNTTTKYYHIYTDESTLGSVYAIISFDSSTGELVFSVSNTTGSNYYFTDIPFNGTAYIWNYDPPYISITLQRYDYTQTGGSTFNASTALAYLIDGAVTKLYDGSNDTTGTIMTSSNSLTYSKSGSTPVRNGASAVWTISASAQYQYVTYTGSASEDCIVSWVYSTTAGLSITLKTITASTTTITPAMVFDHAEFNDGDGTSTSLTSSDITWSPTSQTISTSGGNVAFTGSYTPVTLGTTYSASASVYVYYSTSTYDITVATLAYEVVNYGDDIRGSGGFLDTKYTAGSITVDPTYPGMTYNDLYVLKSGTSIGTFDSNGTDYAILCSIQVDGVFHYGRSSALSIFVKPVLVEPTTTFYAGKDDGATLNNTVYPSIAKRYPSGVTLTKYWYENGATSPSDIGDLPLNIVGTYTYQLRVSYEITQAGVTQTLFSNSINVIITIEDTIVPTTTTGFPYLTTYFASTDNSTSHNVMTGADVSSVGNALKIDYLFSASTVAGYKVSDISSGGATYSVAEGVNYCDTYGRFNRFLFKFGTFREITELGSATAKAKTLPVSATTDFDAFYFESPTITYHKDSGNAHALTYQLNFLANESETSKIILGYHFIEKMLSSSSGTRRVYMSIYDTYNKFDNLTPKGELYNSVTITTEVGANYVKLTLGGGFIDNAPACKSWAICDGDNNVLIAYNMVNPFNADDIDRSGVIYFNFSHRR